MKVLGIEVAPAQLRKWREWLAPTAQPFFLPASEAVEIPGDVDQPLDPELRDTYEVWGVDRSLTPVWLSEEAFYRLPRTVRGRLVRAQVLYGRGAVPTVRGWADLLDATVLRSQGDGHRFVWWPSLLDGRVDVVLARVLNSGRLPSCHQQVDGATWRRAEDVLPGGRRLAGTFAAGSGPNCFGTAMAAAGVVDAADAWVRQDWFEAWLAERALPGGRDRSPGTVLVWRDTATGVARHVAVTVGDGWGLHKPSQAWSTPRQVLAIGDILRTCRTPGWRLHRYRLTDG